MSLKDLVDRELIDRQVALEVAPNVEALKMASKASKLNHRECFDDLSTRVRGRVSGAGRTANDGRWCAVEAPTEPESNTPTVTSDGWPEYPLPAPTQFRKDPERGRGPGFYFSLFKIALVCALFFLWVKTTDWVSQDCLRLSLNYLVWNSVVFGVFAAAFLLLWVLPWFEVTYALMVVAYLAPLGVYLIIRNKTVEAHLTVMTPIICGTCLPMSPVYWASRSPRRKSSITKRPAGSV